MSKRRKRTVQRGVQAGCGQSQGQRGKTVTALAEDLDVGRKFFILVARTVAGWRQGGAGARQGEAAREHIEISFTASRRCS